MSKDIDIEAAHGAADDVQRARLKIMERHGITFGKIINEFKSIAFSNIRDYIDIDEGGAIQARALAEIGKRKSAAIKKVKEHTTIKESSDGTAIFKDSRIEYELYDKQDSLKYLCRLRGDEPAEKHEMSGAVIVMRPDPIVKPKDAGKGSAE